MIIHHYHLLSPLVIPHITVWGSCFSLGSRRFSPSVRRVLLHHLHNSSQLHFSHLTYHTSLITSHLTPHLSHLTYHITSHTSLITSGARGHHWAAAAFRVAGAVHRASWSSCGARGRRWAAAAFRVAGAVHRASCSSCGARGRRWALLTINSSQLHFSPSTHHS